MSTIEDFERERVIREQLRQKPQNELPLKDALTRIRGKYAFVQTSVDKFLQRKHEDLELEDPQWHQS